jgi:hypothetical protein
MVGQPEVILVPLTVISNGKSACGKQFRLTFHQPITARSAHNTELRVAISVPRVLRKL